MSDARTTMRDAAIEAMTTFLEAQPIEFEEFQFDEERDARRKPFRRFEATLETGEYLNLFVAEDRRNPTMLNVYARNVSNPVFSVSSSAAEVRIDVLSENIRLEGVDLTPPTLIARMCEAAKACQKGRFTFGTVVTHA